MFDYGNGLVILGKGVVEGRLGLDEGVIETLHYHHLASSRPCRNTYEIGWLF